MSGLQAGIRDSGLGFDPEVRRIPESGPRTPKRVNDRARRIRTAPSVGGTGQRRRSPASRSTRTVRDTENQYIKQAILFQALECHHTKLVGNYGSHRVQRIVRSSRMQSPGRGFPAFSSRSPDGPWSAGSSLDGGSATRASGIRTRLPTPKRREKCSRRTTGSSPC